MSASPQKRKKRNTWPITVIFITFAITLILSFLSETTLMGVPIFVAVAVLSVIILIGILFDTVGVAVTIEQPTAYNAMAAKRIRGAREALNLIKNASTISSICNDVVGDICGIVSGAMGAAIVVKIVSSSQAFDELVLSVLVSSLVAALTVGGKAIGKTIALKHSHKIVFTAGKIISVFKRRNKKCRTRKTKRS